MTVSKLVQSLARPIPLDLKVRESPSLVWCFALQARWGGNIIPTARWGSPTPSAWWGATHTAALCRASTYTMTLCEGDNLTLWNWGPLGLWWDWQTRWPRNHLWGPSSLSSRGVHIHSQIALVSHSVESKNSDSLPHSAWLSLSPLVQTGSVSSLLLASAEMTN